MSNIQRLPLTAINILASTQSRAGTNKATVREYTEALEQGVEFPPVIVYTDSSESGKWLADGFHRYEAHQAAGLPDIACDVRNGSRREAVLFSVGANASHGLRRTIEDKRRAVAMLLDDAEWSTWSDRDIARQCGVSHSFVAAVRSPAVAARQRENRQQSAAKKYAAVESDSTGEIELHPGCVPPRPAPSAAATPPALVQQVLEQQAAAATPTRIATPRDDVSAPGPVEIITPDAPDDANEDAHDDLIERLAAESDELKRKLDEANARVAEVETLLARNDLAVQVEHWRSNFEGISNLNQTLIAKLNKIEPEFEAQRETLCEVRAILGVDRNRDIVAALKARRAA